MDIQYIGFASEAVKWIAEGRLDDLIRTFRLPVVIFSLVAGFLYLCRNKLDTILHNKHAWWAIGAIFFCLTMVSGQMWNHIRGPPFVYITRNGGVEYIHGSSRGQFMLETYIVWVFNAAIVLGMLLMTETRKENLSIFGLLLVIVFYSLLLSVFRSKSRGYPL